MLLPASPIIYVLTTKFCDIILHNELYHPSSPGVAALVKAPNESPVHKNTNKKGKGITNWYGTGPLLHGGELETVAHSEVN